MSYKEAKKKLDEMEAKAVAVAPKGRWEELGLPTIDPKTVNQVEVKMEILKDELVRQMESGRCPWRNPLWIDKPFSEHDGAVKVFANPKNIAKKDNPDQSYTGNNRTRLMIVSAMMGYKSNWWGTLANWRKIDKGLYPRKGSKSIPCFRWIEPYPIKDASGAVVEWVVMTPSGPIKVEGETDGVTKHFNVFNLEDMVASTPAVQAKLDALKAMDKDEIKISVMTEGDGEEVYHRCPELDALPELLGCELRNTLAKHGSYDAMNHVISMPHLERTNYKGYYATLVHECVHATMQFLGRVDDTDPLYTLCPELARAKEELITELASIGLLTMLGINNWEGFNLFENSASYLKQWAELIKTDAKVLNHIISDSNKAVRYIMSILTDRFPRLVSKNVEDKE